MNTRVVKQRHIDMQSIYLILYINLPPLNMPYTVQIIQNPKTLSFLPTPFTQSPSLTHATHTDTDLPILGDSVLLSQSSCIYSLASLTLTAPPPPSPYLCIRPSPLNTSPTSCGRFKDNQSLQSTPSLQILSHLTMPNT